MRAVASARMLIALSFAVFGVQHFRYGEFVTRVVPGLPSWIPWHLFWVYAAGGGLLVAAWAMAMGKARAAVVTGAACLAAALLLHLPIALSDPANGGRWTAFGKGITLAGTCFIVAGSLGLRPARFLRSGECALAAFMILCGVEHFLYRDFVASLIPPWIPWHVFWTYFAALALIAGGAGILFPPTSRLAALLSGIMILSWVPLVHIPLALHDLRDPRETTPVFEALAFGCAAVLAAAVSKGRQPAPPLSARASA